MQAGFLISKTNYLDQPSNKDRYGYALLFYEVGDVSENIYAEKLFQYIEAKDGYIQLISSNKEPLGIHTYAVSKHYEVIDIKISVFNPMEWIRRVKKSLARIYYEGLLILKFMRC